MSKNTFIEIPANAMSIAQRGKLYNVGINDADYIVKPTIEGKKGWCPIHFKWHGMLQRCYDANYHARQPTYIHASVCDEWKYFSVFKKWMDNQPNNHLELDKDLLVKGNKNYNPKCCLFVSKGLNNLLTDNKASRGQYKIGVSWREDRNKFQSRVMINGKNKHLGYFKTEQEANRTYCAAKFDLIHHIIENNPYNDTEKALEALYQHADALVEEYSTICYDPRLIDVQLEDFKN